MEDWKINDIVECPVCECDVKWGLMVWLNGKCTCPDCYERELLDMKIKMKRKEINKNEKSRTEDQDG